MKKIVWNLEENKAIPIDNIKCLEIINTAEYADKKLSDFSVVASYTICTGEREVIFTADRETDCFDFVNDLYK